MFVEAQTNWNCRPACFKPLTYGNLDPTASCLQKGRTVDHYNRGMVLCKQALVLRVWEAQDSGVEVRL